CRTSYTPAPARRPRIGSPGSGAHPTPMMPAVLFGSGSRRGKLYFARPGMRHRGVVGIRPVPGFETISLVFVWICRRLLIKSGVRPDGTSLLEAAAAGDRQAAADLLSLAYNELRKLAAALMATARPRSRRDRPARNSRKCDVSSVVTVARRSYFPM